MATSVVALPRPAPVPVLALGAYLKNTACRIDGAEARFSALHGDLGEADACRALDASARELAAQSPRLDAVVHDLHPDFPSSRLAATIAAEHGLAAWPVQHHRAHVGVVQAEAGLRGATLALALDGVGLGSDGQAWGGELLWADDPARSSRWQRAAHLPALALPGGDRAAREPWRVAAALLWQQGRGDEIVARLAPASGAADDAAARGVAALLQRQLNCPTTTAAGRWFDAAAAALGLHQGPQAEAEAALALERAATAWIDAHPADAERLPAESPWTLARLPEHVATLFDLPAARRGEGAARFHLGLAQALADTCLQQALAHDVGSVVLSGGCFFNRLLTRTLEARLQRAGLRVLRAAAAGCGDAGLALGQAWLASWAQARGDAATALSQPERPTLTRPAPTGADLETPPCA
jgi:hydrogenase maturation protein HypF